MIHKIVNTILKKLKKWRPYVYHKTPSGSTYIKFHYWGLGSVRISNHGGKIKYNYEWRVRTDKPRDHIRLGIYNGIPFVEVGPGQCSIRKLVTEFEKQASKKGINPIDTKEYKHIERRKRDE